MPPRGLAPGCGVKSCALCAPVIVQGHSAAGLHVGAARLQPSGRLLHARGRQRIPLPLPAGFQGLGSEVLHARGRQRVLLPLPA